MVVGGAGGITRITTPISNSIAVYMAIPVYSCISKFFLVQADTLQHSHHADKHIFEKRMNNDWPELSSLI